MIVVAAEGFGAVGVRVIGRERVAHVEGLGDRARHVVEAECVKFVRHRAEPDWER